jgi:hypothetical protein
MLVSRDRVHSDEGSSEEASAARLVCVETFDDALDQLGRISSAGALARSVLAVIWNELKATGIALPDEVPARRFSDLQFAADDQGHANTRLTFDIDTAGGRLCGEAHIFQATPSIVQADFAKLTLGGEQWGSGSLNLVVDGQLPKSTSPAAERMTELRNIIDGKQ